MFTKKRAIIISATAITGTLFMSQGALFLVSAETVNVTPDQTIQVNQDQVQYHVTVKSFNNIAPGDSENFILQIQNTGTRKENITIQHTLSGAIFKDNGNTGVSQGTAADPNDNNNVHGISIDYKGTQSKSGTSYEFDNNPLKIGYKVSVSGWQADALPITVGPFSTDNTSPSFQLPAGQSATVQYTYAMPIEAHNDYQGTIGNMGVEILAETDEAQPPPPPPPHSGGNPPSPPPPSGGGTPTPPPPPSGGGTTPTPPPVPPAPPNGAGTPVIGGTSPVTGLPVGSILFEGLSLLGLGSACLWLSKKPKKQ